MGDTPLSMPVHGFVDCLVSLHACAAPFACGMGRFHTAPQSFPRSADVIAVQHGRDALVMESCAGHFLLPVTVLMRFDG